MKTPISAMWLFLSFAFVFLPCTLLAADLKGDVSCRWGKDKDCNPCVHDVPTNFQHISTNSERHTKLRIEASDDLDETMFNAMGGAGLKEPLRSGLDELVELTKSWHIQGIGRIPNLDNNSWIVFTRSIRSGAAGFFAGALNGTFTIGGHLLPKGAQVLLDSDKDGHTGNSYGEITEYYRMSDASRFSPYARSLNHYGGLQMLGKYMVTATQCFHAADHCDDSDAMAYIYDLSNPNDALLVSALDVGSGRAGAAAAKLADGSYLLILNNAATLDFYTSDSSTLSLATSWSQRPNLSFDTLGDNVCRAFYQNLNLITECGSGDLYLIGTYGTNQQRCALHDPTDSDSSRDENEDWMDLFRIEGTSDFSELKLSKVKGQHMYCEQCEFTASGNIYITPEHNMLLYSSLKDDDDHDDSEGHRWCDDEGGSGDICFEEFYNDLNYCNRSESSDKCDSDGDGKSNIADDDDDNDGIDDRYDYFSPDAAEWNDCDGDHIGDNADTEDQNNCDFDGDGVSDVADPDDDNDGAPDPIDAFPYDPVEFSDLDGDGVGGVADPDDDNDAVADTSDLCPLEKAYGQDADGDGCLDSVTLILPMIDALGTEFKAMHTEAHSQGRGQENGKGEDHSKVPAGSGDADRSESQGDHPFAPGTADRIPPGIKESLRSKILSAQESLEAGLVDDALGSLKAFVNHLRAQRGKHVTEADADALTAQAEIFIGALQGHCADTDGGRDYFNRGTVESSWQGGTQSTDACSTDGIGLAEHNCVLGEWFVVRYSLCTNRCADGACRTPDLDADGVLDTADNCPIVANPFQEDVDADAIGDACIGQPTADEVSPAVEAEVGGCSLIPSSF